MTYFSDREHYNNEISSMQITINAWNGIATLVNSLIANNNFAKDFPRQCPDGNGIFGVDEHSFYTKARSVIPAINFLPENGCIETLSSSLSFFEESDPFENNEIKQNKEITQFTYNTLDFIEFVFKHIVDVENDQYHEFFHHYELKFLQTTSAQKQFVSDINEIFERNNIAFKLCSNGEIQRIIDKELEQIIAEHTRPEDEELDKLLQQAISKIKKSKFEERQIALERLWDAFERLKTIIKPDNKKESINQLLEKVSNNNQKFQEQLNKECNDLTAIGNNFMIRHFEKDKIAINDSQHLDYLFFRMYTLIRLLLTRIQC